MRLPFRKKDKKKDGLSPGLDELRSAEPPSPLLFPPTYRSSRLLAVLPERVLQRIFTFVCPHTLDETYETCEESANDRGCMLCDLRDLSHCAKVNRTWHSAAIKILYHSVRIDPVHYCSLEAILAERRKQKSRFDRNGIPEDPALARLRLLRRTVRDDPTRIGKVIEFLKTPYMIRESCHVELAQTIAVLPNLKYVDLPEGMFCDDPAYTTLRLEVQARCPNIRKATFVGGSERSFSMLTTGQIWPHLEVMELNRLNVDPKTLRNVLTTLTNLRALKVAETYSLSDEVLVADGNLAPLPALEELVLKDIPSLTSVGLVDYLSWYETQRALKVLTLKDTGVQPWKLQDVLAMAPSLRTIAIQSRVSAAFPTNDAPKPLAHGKLRTLRYEISARSQLDSFATQGYYSYLSNSVLAGGLPSLRRLYVLDEKFPEQLQNLPPPEASFGAGRTRTSSNPSQRRPPALQLSPPKSSAPPPVSPLHQHFPATPTRPKHQARGNANPSNPNPNRFSSNNPFAPMATGRAAPGLPTMQTLEVFTKSDEFGKWNFARVDSIMGPAATARRPDSCYGLDADVSGQGWDRGEARRSVMVGNGTGGFLSVSGNGKTPPDIEPVPALPSEAGRNGRGWI